MHAVVLYMAAVAAAGLLELQAGMYYEVTLRTGESFHAVVIATNERVAQFRRDEPDDTSTSTIPLTEILDAVPEKPEVRERRIEGYHRKRGDEKVPTPGLGPSAEKWVSQMEYTYARRAAELEEERDRRLQPPEPQVEPVATPTGPTEPAPPPGFMALWGLHIALVIAAAAIIGVILRMLVFPGND